MTIHPTPAAIGSACWCLALKRAARVIARRYDEALRPLHLSNGQFAVLTAISGMQSVGIQALATTLGMDRTTLTAVLKPLRRRGLVVVEVADDDLRGRNAHLTEAGDTMLAAAIPLWQVTQQSVSHDLGSITGTDDLRYRLARLS